MEIVTGERVTLSKQDVRPLSAIDVIFRNQEAGVSTFNNIKTLEAVFRKETDGARK